MNRIRLLILISTVLTVRASARAQELQPYLEGDRVRVVAPNTHFISGKTLEKLHNGAAVPFTVQLTATGAGGRQVSQASQRVVLSYDLWEERYSAVGDSPKRQATGLSAASAQEWCVENVSLPASVLAGEKSFVLKLDVRAASDAPAPEGPGVSVAGLVDVFSRKTREQPSHWSVVSSSIRLADLKEKARKSGRQSFPARRL